MAGNYHYLMLTLVSLSKAGQILEREEIDKGQVKSMVRALGLDKPARETTFFCGQLQVKTLGSTSSFTGTTLSLYD